MGGPTLIPMLDPKGQARMIPMDQVDAAKKAGGKVARKFEDPGGTNRWIPAEMTDAAVKAGGKPVPFGIDDASPKGGALERFVSSFVEPIADTAKSLVPHSAKDLYERVNPITSINKSIVQPAIEQGKKTAAEFKQSAPLSLHPTAEQLEHRQKTLGHGLATVVPVVGPWAANVAEKAGTQVGTGDYAGGAGTVAGNAALALAPKVVGKAGRLGLKAGESMVRNVTETTPRDVAGVVKETSAENEVKTKKAADQTAEHVKQVEEQNRKAREKAEEDNRKNVGDYVDKRREAAHKTEGAELQADYDNRMATEKAKQDHVAAVAEVEAKNADATAKAAREHAEKVQTVEASNAAKQAEYDAAQAKRTEVLEAVKEQTTKRGQLARQFNQRATRMVERLKTVRDNWKDSTALQNSKGYKPTGKLDVMYDRVRRATQGASVPRSTLADAVLDAEDHIKGSDENIKVFRDILTKAIEDDAPEFITKGGKVKAGHSLAEVVRNVDREGMEAAQPADFSELQGYYTEIGEKLAPGNLPPDVYRAMRSLQNNIGKMMQKMATENKVGSLFRQAQAGYRDYMQTFRESTGPNHSGSPISQALDAADPGYAIKPLMSPETAARVRTTLARFDPDRAGVGGAAKLYDNFLQTARDFDATGTKIKVPKEPKTPVLKATPKYKEPTLTEPPKPNEPTVKLPERTGPPKVPDEVQPKLTAHKPPVQPETVTQTPESLTAAKAENVTKAAEAMRHSKSPLVSAVAGYGTIKALLVRNLATAGLDITARLLYGAAKPAIANILERPKVVAELSKFTEKDAAAIAKLPARQRAAFADTMGKVASEAEKKGVTVSPALVGAIAAAGQQDDDPDQITEPPKP